ncbi:protein-tyrosine phosphatase [Geothermobacter ehrlichii]|uniref:protein-tyrosine-phosphatase n=1 Tax=Geothermobacter ehrlichii TaxID=213224 RepID=A0A5D3WJ92_9BACT|nr:CpsB/CapC family capsule biosynthesis tyrosine phosphatase [Geothermobacter ehrlichii]TYO98335.1 protein-tyrosine phosphatase [Geothermobacter ehrlichii]
MIDLHCHILPGVDDGPADLEGALAMARRAAADGIRVLAATPHVPLCGLGMEEIAARVAELQAVFDREGIGLRLIAGADVATSLGVGGLCAYRLGPGPALLVEFPHTHLPAEAPELIFELSRRGRIPVVTHPERNPGVARDPERIVPLIEAGGLVQVTAESLTGGFGPVARSCARHLLRRGWVHLLASDGHSADWRPPCLSVGLKAAVKLVGRDEARKLVVDHPQKVLDGNW